MRRRVSPSSASPADGVFWWREYPADWATNPAAVEDWSDRFDAWCEEHGVDSGEVTSLAAQMGLTDKPWNPYEDGGDL